MSENLVESSELPLGVVKIEVGKLFGVFDYKIPIQFELVSGTPQLIILYGENGSGKTTILNLVYHLFGYDGYGGHRSFLASTPFEFLSVVLSNGATITARKEPEELVGTFILTLDYGDGNDPLTFKAEVDHENTLIDSEMHVEWLEKYTSFLKTNGIVVKILDENRKAPSRSNKQIDKFDMLEVTKRRKLGKSSEVMPRSEIDTSLFQALESTHNWFRQKALGASNVGIENVGNIYKGVVNRIATSTRTDQQEEVTSEQIEDMLLVLEDLQVRNTKYSIYSLTTDSDLTSYLDVVRSASTETTQIIFHVLEPYVNGMKARLDALSDTFNLIQSLITPINDLFSNKCLEFNLERGFTILSPNGNILLPEQLSSGEKQLLLLLCTIITSRSDSSVLIIDEPELSLNVKWQRSLIRILIDLVKGSNMQFMLATHSIEMITQFQRHVTHLKS